MRGGGGGGGGDTSSKHCFMTSFLLGGRCLKTRLGVWEQNTVGFRDSRFDALVAKAPTEGVSTTPRGRSFQSLTVLEKKLEKPLFNRTGKLCTPLFSPSLISLMVSVDVKRHVYLLTQSV